MPSEEHWARKVELLVSPSKLMVRSAIKGSEAVAKWLPESQDFVAAQSKEFASFSRETKLHTAEGIYGVVRCADFAVLVTIAETKHIVDLPDEGPAVYAVKKFDIFHLPCSDALSQQQRSTSRRLELCLRKSLEESHFFACFTANLCDCIQSIHSAATHAARSIFMWNRVAAGHFPTDLFCVPVVRGSVLYRNIGNIHFLLISRMSAEFAGTRYFRRGIDSTGHTANFVETEQVVWGNHRVSTFVVVRGSVPLHWQQLPDWASKPQIRLLRTQNDNNMHFREHATRLRELYPNKCVCCLSLLSRRCTKEKLLNEAYAASASAAMTHWDWLSFESIPLGSLLRKGNQVMRQAICQLRSTHENMFLSNVFHLTRRHSGPLLEQLQITRVNCLDCLDRTNIAQCFISSMALDSQAEFVGASAEEIKAVQNVAVQLWFENGNVIGLLYAGSPSFQGDRILKGHRTIRGALTDYLNFARRYIQQFRDGGKQDAASLLTGAGELAVVRPTVGGRLQRNSALVGLASVVLGAAAVCLNTVSLFWSFTVTRAALQLLWVGALCWALFLIKRRASYFTSQPSLVIPRRPSIASSSPHNSQRSPLGRSVARGSP